MTKMYYKIPDGTPTVNLPTLIPQVISPQFLSAEELLHYGVAECVVTQDTIEWWQERGPKEINTSEPVHVIHWPAVERSVEDVRAMAWSRVKDRRTAERAKGVQYTFADGSVGTLQVGDDDISNLLAISSAALAAIIGGNTTALLPFTDAENTTRFLPPADALALTSAAFSHGAAVHVISQDIRKNIAADAALTVAEIVAASKWPGDA